MKMRSYAITMVMVVVSFLGFCIENFFTFFRTGTVNNRNMILPFLFGYGMAIVALYALFGTPEAPHFLGHELSFANGIQGCLYYFAMSFICICGGEIILGYMTEWICGIVWWDYTGLPLTITRYTSVITSSLFSGLIVIFMRFLWDPMIDGFLKINPRSLVILSVCCSVLLSLDMINSGLYMLTRNKTLVLWEVRASRSLSDILIDAFN